MNFTLVGTRNCVHMTLVTVDIAVTSTERVIPLDAVNIADALMVSTTTTEATIRDGTTVTTS